MILKRKKKNGYIRTQFRNSTFFPDVKKLFIFFLYMISSKRTFFMEKLIGHVKNFNKRAKIAISPHDLLLFFSL